MVVGTSKVETSSSTGTSQRSGGDDYVPPYLQHLQKEKAPPTKTDYSKYTIIELKNILKELDTKMEKEIEEIKKKYAETKSKINAGIK